MMAINGSSPRCLLLGCGGHARVVLDALRIVGSVEVVGIVDRDQNHVGGEVLGLPVLGDDDYLDHVKAGVTHFVMGVGSTRDNSTRRRLFERARESGLEPLTVVHPASVCSVTSAIGAGSFVAPGAVINAAASLGENVIVNTSAVIEHDCDIGAHVHVASNATLSGGVRIGALSHIGAGAIVLQGITIGKGCVVAAGAVVTKDVPSGKTVKGIPASEG